MPVTFTLWHNADPSGDNKWLSETFTGAALKGYAGDTGTDLIRGDTCLGVVVSWQVEPQPRAPTVLVANQGETTLLPGYGIHYNGEQQFYAFYIDVTGSSSGSKDPFQTDPTNPNGVLNVVLLSRATYLETNLSTNLSTNNLTAHLPALASCLGSSNVTARNPGGSQMGLAGTFSGSMNDSCANLLLQNLMPRNSTGNVTGTYYALNSTQVQLLGFIADTSQVVPFLAVAGYDSPMGGPPQAFNVLGAIFGTIGVGGAFLVTIGTYFHVPALVALGDFLENLPAELAAVGQVILGVLSAVYQGVSAVVQAAMNVLNFLVKVIENAIAALFVPLINSITALYQSLVASLALPLLSDIALTQVNGTNLLTTTEFGEAYDNATGSSSPPPMLTQSAAIADLNIPGDAWVGISVAAFVTFGIAMWALTASTAGADVPFLYTAGVVGPRIAETKMASLALKTLAAATVTALFLGIQGSSSQIQAGFEAVGFTSTLAAFATTSILAFTALSKPSVGQWRGFLGASKLGLFVSLAAVIMAGMYDSISQLLKTLQTATGDQKLSDAVFFTAVVGALFGAYGVGYTALPVWQAVAGSTQTDPLALIALIMSAIATGGGVALAIQDPPQ